tara:strand:- start:28881 stop:30209 length:1329 start_codon:yes stop_codon:yes gene_type:complete
MLLHNYSKYFINICKIYFSDKIIPNDADINIYKQYTNDNQFTCTPFYTPIIDLNMSVESIKQNIRKNYIHRINQAIKKHNIKVKYINQPSQIELDSYIERYDSISLKKGYAPVIKRDLTVFKKNILISYAIYNSKIICGHLYFYDETRLRQRHSYILDDLNNQVVKNISSIANKYLHYSDIFYAKENNFKIFDLGGVYNQDSSTRGVTIFKLGFTDKIEKSYEFTIAKTLKGKIILFIFNYFNLNTINRLIFFIRIILDEIIFNNKYNYKEDKKKSKFLKYFNSCYREFYNLVDAFKNLKLRKQDKIIIFGIENGMALLFFKRFKLNHLKIIENNHHKFNYFSSTFQKYKNLNAELVINNENIYKNINFENYKYIIINDLNLKLDKLTLLLENLSNKIIDGEKYYVIYFNPIYNHIFSKYELFLEKEIDSVISTKIHIYSNI